MFRSSTVKLFVMLSVIVFAFGCATKKDITKQVSPLQSQVAVLTDEVAKIDESIQEIKGGAANQAVAGESFSGSARSHSGGGRTSGGIYRTPSGFELPAVDIQRALKAAGFYNGPIDGKVGPGTESAIREFQQANGLEADGVCGRGTWSKLKSHLSTVK